MLIVCIILLCQKLNNFTTYGGLGRRCANRAALTKGPEGVHGNTEDVVVTAEGVEFTMPGVVTVWLAEVPAPDKTSSTIASANLSAAATASLSPRKTRSRISSVMNSNNST